MTKTKISTILTSLLLVVVLCFSMASCGLNSDDGENSENTTVNENENEVKATSLKTEFVNTANVKLMAASAPVMTAATGVITQKLAATVLPENASNKNVDWSVFWADTSNTSNVSNYITVTPDSDGSTSATVTCKAAFTGNIVITATARQNGYKADCVVAFVGVPANINIVTNLTSASDGYHVAVGNTYTLGTELSNPFGEVGNAYKNLDVSVVGMGTIKVVAKEVYNSGNVKWYDESPDNLDIATIANKFVTASIATDGTVTVNILKSIESYYGSMQRIDGGRTQYYTDCFRDYVTNCYFKIVLTEPNSGVSSSFNVVIDPNAVTGVSVSSGEMYF